MSESPYALLGIARTADERAIKKAYAAKVREFSPETHPEEFKKLRAAYELLSDREARARFDDADKGYGEYGEDVGQRLQDIDSCLQERKTALAREMLDELLAKHPDLAVAHFKRALLLMQEQQWAEALIQIDDLIAREPDHSTYHRIRGRILLPLGRASDAEAAFRRAYKIEKDPGTVLALAAHLSTVERAEEALSLLDDALTREPPEGGARLELLFARFDVCWTARTANRKDATRPFEELQAKYGDEEFGRYVAGRLGFSAAKLFAAKRFDDANDVLEEAAKLYPESPVHVRYVGRTSRPLDSLSSACVSWLSSCAPGPHSPSVPQASFALTVLATIVGGLLVAAALYLRGGLGIAMAIVGTLVLAAGVARHLQIMGSPLRAFVTVHPLYLVRARYHGIEVFPLFLLSNMQATHQYVNGVYSATNVVLTFHGAPPVKLAIRGKDFAEQWVQYVAAERGRALELLAEGMLETHPAVDLLPPRGLSTAASAPAPEPRSWPAQFVERVRAHARRRDIALLVFALATSGLSIGGVYFVSSTNRVTFVSGLDKPVRLLVDGRPLEVPPLGLVSQRMTAGAHTVRVHSVEGEVIRETSLHVPPFTDAVIYNVLGSAPVYVRRVVFTSNRSEPLEAPQEPETYAGQEVAIVHPVKYVFTPPPTSVSSKSGRVVHRQLARLEGEGWSASVPMVAQKMRDSRELVEFMARVVHFDRRNEHARAFLRSVVDIVNPYGMGPEVLKALSVDGPDDPPLGPHYMLMMARRGQAAEAIREASGKTSPAWRVARALAIPVDDALRELKEVHALEPNYEPASYWLSRAYAASGRDDECVKAFESIVEPTSERLEFALCTYAWKGHKAVFDALHMVPEGDFGRYMSKRHLLANVSVSWTIVPGALTSVAKAEADLVSDLKTAFPAWSGHAAKEGQVFRAARSAPLGPILAAAPSLTDKSDGLRAFHVEAVRSLPSPLLAMLMGEMLRVGNQTAAERLYRDALGVTIPLSTVEAFVLRGEREAVLWPLSREVRGALLFVRARALDAAGLPSEEVYKRALSNDPLKLWVTRAKAEWPRVVPMSIAKPTPPTKKK